MTRDEILKREPGLELDELIAEKIFGWQKGTNKKGVSGWQWSGLGGQPVLGKSWNQKWVSGSTPEYSTDIQVAWGVVENPKFYSFSIQKCSGGKIYEAYCVLDGHGVNIDGHAKEKSAPEAICKASLLAMMGDENNGG
jgi:hypothetical protein